MLLAVRLEQKKRAEVESEIEAQAKLKTSPVGHRKTNELFTQKITVVLSIKNSILILTSMTRKQEKDEEIVDRRAQTINEQNNGGEEEQELY